MIMGWVFTGMLLISILCAALLGTGSALAASIPNGAQAGVTLAISLCGAICLWTGAGKLMEKTGVTVFLSRIFAPLLGKIFPSFSKDPVFAGYLSSNFCANFWGWAMLPRQWAYKRQKGSAAAPESQPTNYAA